MIKHLGFFFLNNRVKKTIPSARPLATGKHFPDLLSQWAGYSPATIRCPETGVQMVQEIEGILPVRPDSTVFSENTSPIHIILSRNLLIFRGFRV